MIEDGGGCDAILGVNEVDVHDRDLGLPIVIGQSKKLISKGIKEKLWKIL